MNQREKISTNFSDAYLAAMLEGVNTDEVIRQFSKDFPEMTSAFVADALSLDLLYGDLRSAATPSENEIAAAYSKVSARFAPPPPHHVVIKPGFFAQLKSIFAESPTWAGATLGIGAAVIIALLWQPWVIKESLQQTAHNNSQKAPESIEHNASTPQTFASNEQTSTDPMKTPEVRYRGRKTKDLLTTAQRNHQDSMDAARLMQMASPKSLSAPANLRLESLTTGSIFIHWDPSPDALSYIVEIKGENDANFVPVTQVPQTRTRITMLSSGATYFIRVIAASGERRGLPSDAKSIVIP